MKRKIIGLAVVLMAVAMLTTPVLAIGPWQAAEVNDNENFFVLFGGVGNRRGDASGTNVWAYSTSLEKWVTWKWRYPEDAKGLKSNAVVVHMDMLGTLMTEEYENK